MAQVYLYGTLMILEIVVQDFEDIQAKLTGLVMVIITRLLSNKPIVNIIWNGETTVETMETSGEVAQNMLLGLLNLLQQNIAYIPTQTHTRMETLKELVFVFMT